MSFVGEVLSWRGGGQLWDNIQGALGKGSGPWERGAFEILDFENQDLRATC